MSKGRVKARRKFRALNASHAYAVCDICGREFRHGDDEPYGQLSADQGRTAHKRSEDARWERTATGEWLIVRDHYDDSRCAECLRETP